MLETLDYTIRIGSIPTFLYFDLYLYSAYAAHFVYFTIELDPDFRRMMKTKIRGTRTRHVITFNPNKANPGEVIYIDTPKLKADVCLVPGSLNLMFDFKSKNTKSWFQNNLSKLLTKELTLKMAGEVVFSNTGESVMEVYKDLWRTPKERGNLIEYGIANENLRKLISKDGSGATSGDTEKVSDGLMFSILGTKQRIKLGKILDDHGLYAPYSMINNLQYSITLPRASEIMNAQSGEAVEGYSLENIELEYETIENQELANEATEIYETGKSLDFDHVTLMKTTEWDKDSTLVNETINLPRRSMKAVVLLFKSKTPSGSEEYLYPNIQEVKVTIEGVPNSVYSQGIPKSRLHEEAGRLFGRYHNCEKSVPIRDFYKNQFACVVDLRTYEDSNVFGVGRKLVNTQSGVLLEIKKLATTANVLCKIFVVSDGMLNIRNKNLERVQY